MNFEWYSDSSIASFVGFECASVVSKKDCLGVCFSFVMVVAPFCPWRAVYWFSLFPCPLTSEHVSDPAHHIINQMLDGIYAIVLVQDLRYRLPVFLSECGFVRVAVFSHFLIPMLLLYTNFRCFEKISQINANAPHPL